MSEETYSIPEFASRLRVSDTTVRRWIKNGVLEAVEQPDGSHRIKKSTLEALLDTSLPAEDAGKSQNP